MSSTFQSAIPLKTRLCIGTSNRIFHERDVNSRSGIGQALSPSLRLYDLHSGQMQYSTVLSVSSRTISKLCKGSTLGIFCSKYLPCS